MRHSRAPLLSNPSIMSLSLSPPFSLHLRPSPNPVTPDPCYSSAGLQQGHTGPSACLAPSPAACRPLRGVPDHLLPTSPLLSPSPKAVTYSAGLLSCRNALSSIQADTFVCLAHCCLPSTGDSAWLMVETQSHLLDKLIGTMCSSGKCKAFGAKIGF